MRGVLITLLTLAASTAIAGDLPDGAARRHARSVLPNVVRLEGPGGISRRGLPLCGVLLGDDGVVLTIMRLGSEGSRTVVRLPGGRAVRARVLLRDSTTGVTALALDESVPSGLLASGADLSAGSPVLMAGYAFGVPRGFDTAAVASGIVAQSRPAGEGGSPPARYLLSSAVNPGDAGGALVDGEGRFAGLLLPDRDLLSGLSTAVPLSTLRGVFAGVEKVADALAPAESGIPAEWPVHARLAEVARSAWPAVLSLRSKGNLVGTAFLIGAGRALTNRIRHREGLKAYLPDGRELEVGVLGEDERYDISVLEVRGENLPPAPVLAAKLPPVGAFVVAVGNPNGSQGGWGPLLTIGIVGARNREDRRFGALHTDAAVNRGNLGGPLLDLEGRVVGVLSSLAGDSLREVGANSGIGYAIPIATILPRLTALGKGESLTFRPGYLGVTLDLDPVPGGGIRIAKVQPEHAAFRGGIRDGDVVLMANGRRIEDFEAARRIFTALREGAEVVLVVRRGGERLTRKVRLDPWPKDVPR